MNAPIRRTAVTLAAALLALTAGHPAIASDSDATPVDNDRLQNRLVGLSITHNGSTLAGLVAPAWFGFGFEIAAVSSDVAAKHTAPVFSLPAKTGAYFEQLPNEQATPPPGEIVPMGTASCVYKFDRYNSPRLDDGNVHGISEEYASIFGINYDSLENVFSDLGKPSVWHPQADVMVSVNNRYLGSPYDDLQLRPEFPEGSHTLSWSAETSFNPITDVALPITLAGFFAASEGYIARKLAQVGKGKGAALRRTKHILDLVDFASELGLVAGDVSDSGSAMQWYRDTSVVGAVNRASQTFVVWDIHTPYFIDSSNLPITPFSRGNTIEEQVIEVEAMDFGGVKFDRVFEQLRAGFEPADDCGRQFNVGTDRKRSTLLSIGAPNVVEWYADEIEGGPYLDVQPVASNQTLANGQIRSVMTQRISVVDSQAPLLIPPAGFARYDEDGIDLTVGDFPIGRPRVVDLADPSPTVTNDAPNFLPGPSDGEDGVRYDITWDATDDSSNSASSVDDPANRVQTITLKRPGTNTAPEAVPPLPVQAVTARRVDIQLLGVDTDMIGGRVDPLDFRIEGAPTSGQFEAPDYPYFIDDFRLTPVGEVEEGDNLTRVSPLLHLADRFRLALPRRPFPYDGSDIRGTLLNQEICTNPTPESQAAFGGVIPTNFVYRPSYVYVDDDDNFFIRDNFFLCGIDLGTAPNLSGLDSSGELLVIPRISKWNQDGDLLDEKVLVPLPVAGFDTVDCIDRSGAGGNAGYSGLPGGDFTVDHTGRTWMGFSTNNIVIGFGYIFTHCSIAPDLGDFTFHGTSTADGVTIKTDNVTGPIVGDAVSGVLFQATPENGVIVRRADRPVKLWSADPADMIGILDTSQLDTIAFSDIKVDGDGNVIVLEKAANRMHKYEPVTRQGPSSWLLGDYVGWMGSCTTNKLNPATGIPYNRCDEQKGTSRGFVCTDRTCNRAANTAGPTAGQFNAPHSIEVDPNNIIYVADTENSRVQRFSSEGTFAGEAKSTGSGVNQGDEPGFILGNMGKPKQLSVNSSSFFVMEPNPTDGDEFVHVFKTLPFRDVTDSSAVVRYISDFNYQGSDSFSFVVDDGIDESVPATVDIAITRDFNPPEKLAWQCFAPGDLQTPTECRLNEDSSLYVRLSAEDRDGFISDFPNGLDEHTFSFVEAPASGSLVVDDPALKLDNATTFLYTPDPDFNGTDSFVFTASDANSAAEEQHEVTLTIDPRPDPVFIDADDVITAARGFIRVVSADYSDIDKDPDHEPDVVEVRWGDGVVSRGSAWTNSGNYDLNEREIRPQVELTVNEGVLVASHRYDSVGTYSMQFEVANPSSSGILPNTVSTTTIDVIEATVVGADLASPQASVDPVVPFPIEIDITNLEPDGWAGLTAGNVRTSIDVPEGILIASVDSRCSNANPIECDLGDLAPDEAATISLVASIPLDNAREQQGYLFRLEMFDDGPNAASRNIQVAAVSIADADNDGVIDFDDAFPDDPDYNADSDGDGLADRWELDFGLDPFAADDPLADDDGDGFTLIDEFRNGSYPYLAERETALPVRPLGVNDALDDRFGRAVAGGDFNQDGYADAVIGAPQAGAQGRVYIQYGADGGAVEAFQEIVPTDTVSGFDRIATDFGRSLAAGDWDNNGFPDLAVGHDHGVYIYYSNGQILDRHDLALDAPVAGFNRGIAILNADLDGDSEDDLIVTEATSGDGYSAYLYLSSRGGLDADPLRAYEFTDPFGDSIAVGDIDGDGLVDLLLGSLGGSNADVFVYLGVDNDWSNLVGHAQRSFTLLPPAGATRFAYSLASGADVGGDGIDDVVVGNYAGAGTVYFYDSADNWVPSFGAVSVSPSQTIVGISDGSNPNDSHGDQFGVALAMGHLDADGYADLVVGGNRAGINDQGQVRLFRGGLGGFDTNDQVEQGWLAFDMLGYSVSIPGDIDGNGFNDVIAGAPDIVANGRPAPDGGTAQIFYHGFVASDPNDDPDGDGVATVVDNCPATPNTNQADIDGDGLGDVCDPDIDGDGTTNDLDSCPLIGSGDHTDFDSDGQGNVCDEDDDDDGTVDVDDPFPLDDRYTADTDGDGMPDSFESQNGLDSNNANDAQGDLDGDGRTNLEEFEQGTDINMDDVAPIVAAPADIIINSVGPFTVVDLGVATAVDAKDGNLVATADNYGPFVPGRHVVSWQVSDAAGNDTTDVQLVDVIPLVGFDGTTIDLPEGGATQVTVVLNGEAPEYPVTVPFTVSGTANAGSDYVVFSSSIVVSNNTVGTLDIASIADAISDDGETIVLTIGQPLGATASASSVFTLSLREGNVAPDIEIDVLQGASRVTTVTQDGGTVDIFGVAADVNQPSTLSFDWSGTDAALQQAGISSMDQLSVDPAGVPQGVYRVAVVVTDDGVPQLSATAHRYIEVVESTIPLGNGDTDGDGVIDVDEGAGDANGNGVDDYVDPTDQDHLLIAREGGQAFLQVLEGQRLRLGPVAMASGGDTELTMSDIETYGNDGRAAPGSDDTRFRYPGGLFDFEISDLPVPGASVLVVIPQSAIIPDAATYRKFTYSSGWSDIVTDVANKLMSAPGDLGVCPAPGNAGYGDGLTAGHACVQLMIEDGGPNDADGLANGVIRDPGGVAMQAVAVAANAQGMSVSNKTVSSGATDVEVLRFNVDVNSPDVEVSAITLDAGGTGNDATDINNIEVWNDVNADGLVDAGDTLVGSGNFVTNDGTLTITFASPYMLPMGITTFLVSYDF